MSKVDDIENDTKLNKIMYQSNNNEEESQNKTIHKSKNSASVASLIKKTSKFEEYKLNKDAEYKYTQLSKCYSNRRREIIQTLQHFPVISKPKNEIDSNKSAESMNKRRMDSFKCKDLSSALPKVL